MLQTLARRSRRGVLGLVAGLVALALLVQPVAGQATRQLDQQQTAQDSFATYNNTAIFAQTFTAGLTGALDQVDLPLGQSGFVGGSTFTVEIRNVGVGGVPGSTVLASTTQPVSSLPVAAILPLPIASYSLSPGAPVVAGTQYAIVVSTTTTTGLIAWAGATGDPYPAGVGYSAAPPGHPSPSSCLRSTSPFRRSSAR